LISNTFFILPETIQSAVQSPCILADSTPIVSRKSTATITPHATVYRRTHISHRRHHERRCADPMR
ncbi:hypothetical protein HYDPIDRAFT_112083, partial [Hydnomerulius pinastri MD-312]